MKKSDFYTILRRYRSGEASPEEKRIIDEWYDSLEKQENSIINEGEEKELEIKYWASIASQMRTRSNRVIFLWTSLSVAASVLIAALFFVYKQSHDVSPFQQAAVEEEQIEWKEIRNEKNTAEATTLPDGSNVTLEPNSVIKIAADFNVSDRKVRLQGKAFFQVAHNTHKPFIVYTNEVTTKVLGTSFTVRGFETDRNIIVSVRSGRVSVSTHSKNNRDRADEVVLTPNQEIVYNRDEEKILRRLVEAPQPILTPEEIKRMRFEDAPVKEIFEAIEKIYGVDIEFDEELFSSCSLTTSLSDGDLNNRLTIITSAMGATFSLEENKIIISGTGCK